MSRAWTSLLAGALLLPGSLLTAGAAVAQSSEAAAIQAELSGKRVSLQCVDGTTGSGTYTMERRFGVIRGTYRTADGKTSADSGRVRADGDRLCLTFQTLNGGEEQCFGARRQGPGRFQFTIGPVAACTVRTL